MFYTEYRPQKFSDLVGLSQSLKSLQAQIAKGETPHALFFYGPRGTGKTSTARIVAKALNCLDLQENGEPCGKCQNCKSIQNGRFLDLIEIDAASNRGIDDIRDLREKIKLVPSGGKYKVYIVDEVHMLTTEAFNALLKTLEEPPKHAVFVLATTDPHKVPMTIKSRCQSVEFKRADMASLVIKLGQIAKDQKAKVSEADLKLIASAGNGGFRDAETLLEEVIKGGVTAREVIGLIADSRIPEFVDYLVKKDSKAAIVLVNQVYETGVELSFWTKELLEYLRKLMLAQAGLGRELVDVTEEQFEEMQRVVGADCNRPAGEPRLAPTDSIFVIVLIFTRAYENLKLATVPQLPLEVAVLEAIQITDNKQQITKIADRAIESVETNHGTSKTETTAQPLELTDIPKKQKIDKLTHVGQIVNSDVSEISVKWDEILLKIKPYNHSLEAVLRSCFPLTEVRGQKSEVRELIICTPFKFHMEKLKDPKNYQIVKKVLEEVLGQEMDYTCRVQKKEVTPLDRLKSAEKQAKKLFNGEVGV